MKPTIYSMVEIAADYQKYCQLTDDINLNLGDWLPSLKRICRPLVPGELAFFMAGTGVGKSMILQNIAMSTQHPSLFFELELPKTLMFERFMAAAHRKSCRDVEASFKGGEYLSVSQLANIFVCDASRLSAKAMYELIMKESEAKIGTRPVVVFVDYIGLMTSGGKSRYERVSIAAEDLKVLAKECNAIVIAATQVARPGEDDNDGGALDIHSAKDSGSIENSCGLLIGAWRDKLNPDGIMWLKILKDTKGKAGDKIRCCVDGSKMLITEAAYTDNAPDRTDLYEE